MIRAGKRRALRHLWRTSKWVALAITSFVAGAYTTTFVDPNEPSREVVRQQVTRHTVSYSLAGLAFVGTALVGLTYIGWRGVETFRRWWLVSRSVAAAHSLVATIRVPITCLATFISSWSAHLFFLGIVFATGRWHRVALAFAIAAAGAISFALIRLRLSKERPIELLALWRKDRLVRARRWRRRHKVESNRRRAAGLRRIAELENEARSTDPQVADIAKAIEGLRVEIAALRDGLR